MSDETPNTPELPDDLAGVEDFDAFWQSADRPVRTTTVMGRTLTLPDSLPLRFEMEARRLKRSKRERDIRRLVAILCGEDALDHWTDAGMTQHQFMVLLAWLPRVIAGDETVTLAQVDAEVRAGIAQALADPT